MQKHNKAIVGRFSVYIWLVCFVICLIDFLYMVLIRKELFNSTLPFIAYSFFITFLIGCTSFALGVFLLTWNNFQLAKIRPASLLSFLMLPIYPIYLLAHTIKSYFSRKPRFFDIRHGLIAGSLILGIVWLYGYAFISMGVLEVLGFNPNFSVLNKMDSMAPTIPGGSGYRNHNYQTIVYRMNPEKAYQFKRGDIISFSTTEAKRLQLVNNADYYNFVKRIVAIPGDTVEIKGGLVFVNNEAVDERYTFKANSTYIPESFKNDKMNMKPYLTECQKITIPEKTLFVLGDNREHSDDSRLIGLVGFSDVKTYITYEEQQKEYYEGVNIFLHSKDWRKESSLNPEIVEKAKQSCNPIQSR